MRCIKNVFFLQSRYKLVKPLLPYDNLFSLFRPLVRDYFVFLVKFALKLFIFALDNMTLCIKEKQFHNNYC